MKIKLNILSFLFSHGVFNDYCYFCQFKNEQDIQNNYLDIAFIDLPAFEFDSMDNLIKTIKIIKYAYKSIILFFNSFSLSSSLDLLFTLFLLIKPGI